MSVVADTSRTVRVWLWVLLAMIFLMVIVGGITRLTGSGLSMVEWRPLIGALPPLSHDAWTAVFVEYQRSPQYQQVNRWMGLAEFQRIFFWEYTHRLLGRLVGVVFAIPFVVFLIKKRLRGRTAWLATVAFVLGGAQGALGWYMVKSGLVDVPAVSHYRLAAHLMLAFLTAQYVLWLWLELRARSSGERHPQEKLRSPSRVFGGVVAATMVLLLVQIVYGAFMAGKHAGHVSSTFPDMNGSYGPGPFFTHASVMDDILNGAAAIHWVHRSLAWLLVLLVIGLVLLSRREPSLVIRRGALVLLAVLVAQLTLGAATVMLQVPVWLAVVHQGGAFVLLCCATWLAYEAGILPRGFAGPAEPAALVLAPPGASTAEQ